MIFETSTATFIISLLNIIVTGALHFRMQSKCTREGVSVTLDTGTNHTPIPTQNDGDNTPMTTTNNEIELTNVVSEPSPSTQQ